MTKLYDDEKYKGMLSMMPSDAIRQYTEDLEDCIMSLTLGSGPEIIPDLLIKRCTDGDGMWKT
jgi:hypothetical protein